MTTNKGCGRDTIIILAILTGSTVVAMVVVALLATLGWAGPD